MIAARPPIHHSFHSVRLIAVACSDTSVHQNLAAKFAGRPFEPAPSPSSELIQALLADSDVGVISVLQELLETAKKINENQVL